jgi:hypothetical protein
VPTLFWPEWAFRLDTEDLPWGTARQVMSRLLLTIGCVMSTPELERHLHSTVEAQRIAQAANNFRAHPNWEGIITALLRLHEHLQAHPPPIDYQRRRTLNYDHLLPEQQWTHLVADEGLRTSPTTAAAARLWLIEQLSGAPVPNTPQALHCRGVCTDRMRTTLTPQLVRALNAVSADYLGKQGVSGEPLTWVPPLSLLEGLNLPGKPPETIEPNSIHKLLDTGLTVTALATDSTHPCGRSATSSNTTPFLTPPSEPGHRTGSKDAVASAPANTCGHCCPNRSCATSTNIKG